MLFNAHTKNVSKEPSRRSYLPLINIHILFFVVYMAESESDSGFNRHIPKIFAPLVRSWTYITPHCNFLVNGLCETAHENGQDWTIILGSTPQSLIIHDATTDVLPIFWFTFTHSHGFTASCSAAKSNCPAGSTGNAIICVPASAVLHTVMTVHGVAL